MYLGGAISLLTILLIEHQGDHIPILLVLLVPGGDKRQWVHLGGAIMFTHCTAY